MLKKLHLLLALSLGIIATSSLCAQDPTSPKVLSDEQYMQLAERIEELEQEDIPLDQALIKSCQEHDSTKAKMTPQTFCQRYKTLLLLGTGALVIAGVGAGIYWYRNNQAAQPAHFLERIPQPDNPPEFEGYVDDDLQRGFDNIDRIIADPNQDPQLVALLQRPRYFTDDRLAEIPLATIHEAGRILQENLYGWNAYRQVDELNDLIDRKAALAAQ